MPVLTETTDAAAGTSTGYAMAVGDYFFGALGTSGDSDWVRVDLTAGQTYTFGLVGVGALTDNLDDSYLRLRNNAGTQIAFDDDGGPGFNSALTFTATATGTYYLDVQSFNNSTAGDYGLSVTLGSKASYDVEMGAGVLLRPDASWAATPGAGATVTWGIRATGPGPGGQAYDAEGVLTSYIVPSAAQIAAVQDVLAMFDGISGLDLVQVNPGGTTNSATMLVGAYSSGTDGAGAFAYYPGSTASSANAGDVWLNNNSVSQTSLPQGSFSHFAILHEVGHGVGLAHPGDYNAAPGVSITYANNAQFIEDTHQYTVMSYFDESNTTASFSSYPDTLLLYDIYALHQQYGADYSYHAGNTTYGFNATVGGAYDFTTNTTPVLSIWDGGGTDTLDLSGYGMNQVIDLREGRFSSVGGYSGNLSIAIGAVIENAVGGSGNDTITGNTADNTITGNDGSDMIWGDAGNDTLYGGANDDTLIGGEGADTIYGQGGNDTASYAGAATGIGIRLDGTTGWNGAAGDALFTVENVTGSDHNDKIIGDVLANRLDGGKGNDTLYGAGGDDTLIGGEGADTIYGQGGNDTASYAGAATGIGIRLDGTTGWNGAAGDALFTVENVTGSDHNDKIIGDVLANRLDGGKGNDTLYGAGGDDTLIGGEGADTIYGQGGNDTASYAGAATGIGIRLDGTTGWNGAAGDALFTVENVTGSDHNDKIIGDVLANRLYGGKGNDTLYGAGGDDTLIGGEGADVMYGQGGSDTFVFSDFFGQDVIIGFAATNDLEKIDLSGVTAIVNYADLTDAITPHMTQVGAHVVIDDFNGNTITIENVSLGDLNANDFLF